MKSNSNLIKLTILLISVVQMGTNAISPILSEIANAFPSASASTVQFLMTFPSLMVLFFSLISAVLAKKIAKKWIATIGCFLFCISGLLSFFFHNSLLMLFIWAGMMGIGIGLVVTMATSLVADCFEGKEKGDMMGWQSTAANLGAMTMTFLAGLLAGIYWNYSYLVYLIALPGMILSFSCLPETAHQDDDFSSNEKNSLFDLLKNPTILSCCLLSLLVTLLFNTAPTNLSMLLSEKNIGTAAQSGTAVTLLLLSGSIGGICYGKIAPKLGKFTIVLGFSVLGIGQLICYFASNLVLVFIGCLICGCAISTVMPQVTLDAASQAKGNTSGSSALIMASSNLGGFCAPFITMIAQALFGNGQVAPRFLLSSLIGFGLVILLSILFKKKA